METGDGWKQRVDREQRLAARLRLAKGRLGEARQERVWAVVEAHGAGLSVRQIATARWPSPSRVHQLLGSEGAREIPRRLSQRRGQGLSDHARQEAESSQPQPALRAHLGDELDALRRCREWLERLERGEEVIVNLRPKTDAEREFVRFDRPRVLRVLARIIADLDGPAGYPPGAAGEKAEDEEARRVRHRRRLAESDPPAKRLSAWEERAALRALRDLPPSERG